MISVLVAVYNTVEMLPKCLDSLRYNAFKDLEVIAVDDGSTDGSLNILQKYAAEDSRFKVVHLEKNCGLAHARNVALSHATGDWVMMLDSDDWISDIDITPVSGKAVSEYDCILLQCDMVYPDGTRKRMPINQNEWTSHEATMASINWRGIHGLYMLRSHLYKMFPFDETTRVYSDENNSRLHLLHSKRIGVCNTVYNYYQHDKSLTHSVSDNIFHIIPALRSLQHTMDSDSMATEEIRQEIRNYRWISLTCCMVYYLKNKDKLKETEKDCALMADSYNELINESISFSHCRKLGYWHLKPYSLYKAQVKIFYLLRKLLGRK